MEGQYLLFQVEKEYAVSSDWSNCVYLHRDKLGGSSENAVWMLDTERGTETQIREGVRVSDLHVLTDKVGYCWSEGAEVREITSGRAILSTFASGYTHIRVLDEDFPTAVVSTATEVSLLQQKWVALKSAVLFTSTEPITAIDTHEETLFILSSTEMTLVSLPSQAVLSTMQALSAGSFIYISPSLGFFYSDTQLQSLSLSSASLTTISKARHTYGTASVAPFHLHWILILSVNCSLWLVNAGLEVDYSLQVTTSGTLLCQVGATLSFYILSKSALTRFTITEERMHLKYLLGNECFEEAWEYVRMNPEGFTREDVREVLGIVAEKLGISHLQKYTQRFLSLKLISWQYILASLPSFPVLLPILPFAPQSELSSEIISRLSPLLSQAEKRPILAKFQVFKPEIQSLLDNSACDSEYLPEEETSLESLLKQLSPRVFTILNSYSLPEKSAFLEKISLSEAEILTNIDSNSALQLLNQVSPGLETLSKFPRDLQYSYFLSKWHHKDILPDSILDFLLEEIIKRKDDQIKAFLASIPKQKWDFALELAQKYNFLPAKVFLLHRFGRVSEAISELKTDRKACLQYLEMHWNAELWEHVIGQGLSVSPKTILPCLYTHPAAALLLEQLPGREIGLAQVVTLLRNMRTRLEIYRTAFKSTANEETTEILGIAHAYHRGFYLLHKQLCAKCSQRLSSLCSLRGCTHHTHISCSAPDLCPQCTQATT